ncbi:hypothetical protein [Lacinutrix jangbogonensis]|uniref:hypothetical protein n=1 Tax=Lacinutrix jangbogonensis TaxID=1469557 RepID=UPI00053EBDD9|nr:hypothetical protein [Lacinutrix jangbogonensis]
MAPIKFEEDMKDRLEKRTITPASKSWDTLSKRLDHEEKKSNKTGFWWLGMAASIIGVLLVSNFFINTKITNSTDSSIAKENTTTDTLKIEVPKQIISTPKQEVIVKIEEQTIKKSRKKTEKKPIESTKYYANVNSKNKVKTIVNKTQVEEPLLVDKSTIQNEPLVAIVENIPDKKNNIETKNNITLDNEINSLLAKATEDIAMQEPKSKSIPIDYNGLLIAVEDDLDKTFRDKMFNAVRKGYETIRESVAERND